MDEVSQALSDYCERHPQFGFESIAPAFPAASLSLASFQKIGVKLEHIERARDFAAWILGNEVGEFFDHLIAHYKNLLPKSDPSEKTTQKPASNTFSFATDEPSTYLSLYFAIAKKFIKLIFIGLGIYHGGLWHLLDLPLIFSILPYVLPPQILQWYNRVMNAIKIAVAKVILHAVWKYILPLKMRDDLLGLWNQWKTEVHNIKNTLENNDELSVSLNPSFSVKSQKNAESFSPTTYPSLENSKIESKEQRSKDSEVKEPLIAPAQILEEASNTQLSFSSLELIKTISHQPKTKISSDEEILPVLEGWLKFCQKCDPTQAIFFLSHHLVLLETPSTKQETQWDRINDPLKHAEILSDLSLLLVDKINASSHLHSNASYVAAMYNIQAIIWKLALRCPDSKLNKFLFQINAYPLARWYCEFNTKISDPMLESRIQTILQFLIPDFDPNNPPSPEKLIELEEKSLFCYAKQDKGFLGILSNPTVFYPLPIYIAANDEYGMLSNAERTYFRLILRQEKSFETLIKLGFRKYEPTILQFIFGKNVSHEIEVDCIIESLYLFFFQESLVFTRENPLFPRFFSLLKLHTLACTRLVDGPRRNLELLQIKKQPPPLYPSPIPSYFLFSTKMQKEALDLSPDAQLTNKNILAPLAKLLNHQFSWAFKRVFYSSSNFSSRQRTQTEIYQNGTKSLIDTVETDLYELTLCEPTERIIQLINYVKKHSTYLIDYRANSKDLVKLDLIDELEKALFNPGALKSLITKSPQALETLDEFFQEMIEKALTLKCFQMAVDLLLLDFRIRKYTSACIPGSEKIYFNFEGKLKTIQEKAPRKFLPSAIPLLKVLNVEKNPSSCSKNEKLSIIKTFLIGRLNCYSSPVDILRLQRYFFKLWTEWQPLIQNALEKQKSRNLILNGVLEELGINHDESDWSQLSENIFRNSETVIDLFEGTVNCNSSFSKPLEFLKASSTLNNILGSELQTLQYSKDQDAYTSSDQTFQVKNIHKDPPIRNLKMELYLNRKLHKESHKFKLYRLRSAKFDPHFIPPSSPIANFLKHKTFNDLLFWEEIPQFNQSQTSIIIENKHNPNFKLIASVVKKKENTQDQEVYELSSFTFEEDFVPINRRRQNEKNEGSQRAPVTKKASEIFLPDEPFSKPIIRPKSNSWLIASVEQTFFDNLNEIECIPLTFVSRELQEEVQNFKGTISFEESIQISQNSLFYDECEDSALGLLFPHFSKSIAQTSPHNYHISPRDYQCNNINYFYTAQFISIERQNSKYVLLQKNEGTSYRLASYKFAEHCPEDLLRLLDAPHYSDVTFWVEDSFNPKPKLLIQNKKNRDKKVVIAYDPANPDPLLLPKTAIGDTAKLSVKPIPLEVPKKAFKKGLQVISRFCSLDDIICKALPGSKQLCEIHLKPLNLSFDVNEKGEACSRHENLAGFFIAKKQSHPSLQGIGSYLVLENQGGKKKVLVNKDQWPTAVLGRLTPLTGPFDRWITDKVAESLKTKQGSNEFLMFDISDGARGKTSLQSEDPEALAYLLTLYLCQGERELAEKVCQNLEWLCRSRKVKTAAWNFLFMLAFVVPEWEGIGAIRRRLFSAMEQNRLLFVENGDKEEAYTGRTLLQDSVIAATSLKDLYTHVHSPDPRHPLTSNQEYFLFKCVFHHLEQILRFQFKESPHVLKLIDEIGIENFVESTSLSSTLSQRYQQLRTEAGLSSSPWSAGLSLALQFYLAPNGIPTLLSGGQKSALSHGDALSKCIEMVSKIRENVFFDLKTLHIKELEKIMQPWYEYALPLKIKSFTPEKLKRLFVSYYAIAREDFPYSQNLKGISDPKEKLRQLILLNRGGWDPQCDILFSYIEAVMAFPAAFPPTRDLLIALTFNRTKESIPEWKEYDPIDEIKSLLEVPLEKEIDEINEQDPPEASSEKEAAEVMEGPEPHPPEKEIDQLSPNNGVLDILKPKKTLPPPPSLQSFFENLNRKVLRASVSEQYIDPAIQNYALNYTVGGTLSSFVSQTVAQSNVGGLTGVVVKVGAQTAMNLATPYLASAFKPLEKHLPAPGKLISGGGLDAATVAKAAAFIGVQAGATYVAGQAAKQAAAHLSPLILGASSSFASMGTGRTTWTQRIGIAALSWGGTVGVKYAMSKAFNTRFGIEDAVPYPSITLPAARAIGKAVHIVQNRAKAVEKESMVKAIKEKRDTLVVDYSPLQKDEDNVNQYLDLLFNEAFEEKPDLLETRSAAPIPLKENLSAIQRDRYKRVNDSIEAYYAEKNKKNRPHTYFNLKNGAALDGIFISLIAFHKAFEKQLKQEQQQLLGLFNKNGLTPLNMADLHGIIEKGHLGEIGKQVSLPEETLPEIALAVARIDLKLSRLHQVERLVALLRDLSSLPGGSSIYYEKLEQLAVELKARTAFSLAKTPPKLLRENLQFQACTKNMLWKRQAKNRKKVLYKAGDNAVTEEPPGDGKSHYGIPLSAAHKSDGSRLAVPVAPASLAGDNQPKISAQLRSIFNKFSHVLTYRRDTPLAKETLEATVILLQNAIKDGEPIQLTKEDALCLKAILSDRLYTYFHTPRGKTKQAKEILTLLHMILQIFYLAGVALPDEAHEMYRHRHKLNFPVGPAKRIKKHIYNIAEATMRTITRDPEFYELITSNKLFQLDEKTYDEKVRPRLAEKMSRYHLFDFTDSQRAEFVSFVLDECTEVPAWIKSNKKLYQEVSMVKGMLGVLMKMNLENRVDVNFGASKGGKEEFARPSGGNSYVIEEDSIQNPHETVTKTFLMLLAKGLNETQWKALRTHFQRVAEMEMKSKLSLSKTTVYHKFDTLLTEAKLSVNIEAWLQGKCDPQTESMVYKALCKNPDFCFTYTRHFIRKQIRYWKYSIQNSAHDFSYMYNSQYSCTGTPHNDGTYPGKMKMLRDPTTLGEMLHLISQKCPADGIHLLEAKTPEKILDEILANYFSPGSKFSAIIDGGAQLTGMPNEDVAKAMMQFCKAHRPDISAVKFYKKNAQGKEDVYCFTIGTSDAVLANSVSYPPEECLTYYDERHGFGSDIKQDGDGFETMGPNHPLYKWLQELFRIRGLKKQQKLKEIQGVLLKIPTQQIHIGITHEVQKLIMGEGAVTADGSLAVPKLAELVDYAIECEAKIPEKENFPSMKEKIDSVPKEAVWSKIMSTPSKKFHTWAKIWKKFEKIDITRLEDDPSKIYGLIKTDVKPEDALEAAAIHAVNKLKGSGIFKKADRKKVAETIAGLERPPLPSTVTVWSEKQGSPIKVNAMDGLDCQQTMQMSEEQKGSLSVDEQEDLEAQAEEQAENEQQTNLKHQKPSFRYSEWEWPECDPASLDWLKFSHPIQGLFEMPTLKAFSKEKPTCPFFTVRDLLATASEPALQSMAPEMDERLYMPNNFLPRKVRGILERSVEIGSEGQFHFCKVLAHLKHEPGKPPQILHMGPLSVRDADMWEGKLSSDAKYWEKQKIKTIVWSVPSRTVQAGYPISQNQLREDHDMNLLIGQLKLLDGQTEMPEEEQALKKWLLKKEGKVGRIKKGFESIHFKRGKKPFAWIPYRTAVHGYRHRTTLRRTILRLMGFNF